MRGERWMEVKRGRGREREICRHMREGEREGGRGNREI